jgi:hypothetical protein
MPDNVLSAIKTYKLLHNIPEGSPVTIPKAFVVPHDSPNWPQELWGMKLGQTVGNKLRQRAFSKLEPEFTAVGLSTKRETSARKAIEAIRAYRVVHNIPDGSPVSVPYAFVVPPGNSNWPRDLWGMKLGGVAQGVVNCGAFKEYKEEFSALGLSAQRELAPQQAIKAIKVYRAVHNIAPGSPVIIPYSFIVPQNEPGWPQELWGMRLGYIASNILHCGGYSKYRQEFNALGLSAKNETAALQAINAIKTYRALHNIPEGRPVVIPYDFSVPQHSPEWPQELWGLKLGQTATCILHDGAFTEYRQEFNALGLSAKNETSALQAIEAIKTYRAVHKIPEGRPVVIPLNFVVPQHSPDWPPELWGLRLGQTAQTIVHRGFFCKFEGEFNVLGLAGYRDESARQAIEAIKTYRAVHNIPEGSPVMIPQAYVVPDGSPEWPQELWGLKLGSLVNCILNHDRFRECRDEFKKLGLVPRYGSIETRARQFLLAVDTYRKVFNVPDGRRLFVRRSFVVPHGSPDWPQELWDMKLGNKVLDYVYQNSFSEYTEQFRALGLYRNTGSGKHRARRF